MQAVYDLLALMVNQSKNTSVHLNFTQICCLMKALKLQCKKPVAENC